ncbi:hypothetical protein [Brevundimonas sp.]|uniref:hypothetical protein n=1 Tax=Brevundimonas sp. TaxID=1871086 RepID=UPI0025E2A543|nr:hypothetical protein [Brevundimonas sp.]
MKAALTDKFALEAVSPAALRAYLEFEGWRSAGAFGKFGQIFETPEGMLGGELAVPYTSDIADYASAVANIIGALARAEHRDEIAVYRDLVGSDREVIRVRAPEADQDGSVEVDEGVQLVLNARDLVAAAACAANEPRPVYHLGKVVRASEYMQKVRLGQTEQGSYVVTLLAPVPPAIGRPQIELWPEFEEEPFERQVTRTLARALEGAHDAVDAVNRGQADEVFPRAVRAGVSANLCEALGNLIERGGGIDVSITWARTRPAPIARSHSRFQWPDADILKEVARELRKQEPLRDERVLGYVVKLGRTPEQDDGEVVLRTLVGGQSRGLKASLSPADYQVAYAAHGAKVPISLIGDIDTRTRPWQLTQIRELKVIPDVDLDEDEVLERP